jgi:pyridoxamine 5'-phosphate oxidase
MQSLSAEAPLYKLAAWIREAREAGAPEPEAMALATVDAHGLPTVRIVLARGVDSEGVRFFTNYESKKGRDIGAQPHVALVFHWPEVGRQVRVEGAAERLTALESDEYFRSRPRGSQLSACVSPQSSTIADLGDLRARQQALSAELAGREVPRPPHWGGYRVKPDAIEFWTQGADRLHWRERHERDGDGWRSRRLAP